METRDVIIIGAGHNGLALGCYLARAGLDVAVLDRRGEMGGGLSTEEVTIPGFYHNLHSNFHGAMPFFPPYLDLDLPGNGTTYIHPEANLGMPLADGRALVLYADDERTMREIGRFSSADAEAWAALRMTIAMHAEDILAFAYSPPNHHPDASKVIGDEVDSWFGQPVSQMSALELVKSRFENPHVQALLLFHLAVGGWDVRAPKLGPLAVGFLAFATNWQLCRGGSHHLAHVLGGILLRSGGELRELSHVRSIRLRGGRAVGVTLADGTDIEARLAVVSTVDPHQTFLGMLPPEALPDGIAERIRAIRYGHGDVLFGVHLAMAEPPAYRAAAFNPDIDRTFNVNIGYETPEDLVEHYEEIDRGELPARPRLEVGVNTLFDPSQAPRGKHTALLWQFVPYTPGGDDPAVWDRLKRDYAERCIEAWRAYAPNLAPERILGTYAYTPHDIARKMVNMRRGGFHHAAVLDGQMFQSRPAPGIGTPRTPIPGLYLGGSSAHSHGGIVAAPAWNCLHAMADDFELWSKLDLGERLWARGAERWRELYKSKGIGAP